MQNLENCKSREEGRKALLGLSKTKLQEIARSYNVYAPKGTCKAALSERVVEAVVGFKVDSAAIRG